MGCYCIAEHSIFFYNNNKKRGVQMNITELIKNDELLSYYNFEEVYIIISRLKQLGLFGR